MTNNIENSIQAMQQGFAASVGLAPATTTTPTIDKVQTLEEAKAAKLARLGSQKQFDSLSDTYSVLDDGLKESNKNKVWNDLSTEELQYLLGYAANKYSTPDKAADSRRLYAYETKDGKSKIGVSTGNAATSDVRYDSTIDPRYRDAWRKSGNTGPDLKKKIVDLSLDFDAATVMEGLYHGNKQMLADRKYKDILSAEALKHDGGVSEYYNAKGADVFGNVKQSQMTPNREQQIAAMFDRYVNESKQQRSRQAATATPKTATQQLHEKLNSGAWNEIKQTVAGAASGVAAGAIDLLDTAQELGTLGIQAGYNKATDKNVDIDLIDDKKKESAKKWINELVGYDASRDEASMQKATESLSKLGVDLTDPKTWNVLGDGTKRGHLLDAIAEVITNPSLTAHGLTQIVGSGLTLGAGTKLAAKVTSKISANTAKAADDILTSKLTKTNNEIALVKADNTSDAATKAAKVKELKDSVGVASTLGHYIKGTTFSNADFAVRANEHITKYKEANGGEGPELDKLASILFIDRTLSALEIASMKNVIGLDGALKDVAKDGLAAAMKKATKHMTKSIPQEGIQEGLDALGELVNTKYDAAAYKDMTLKELIAKESDNIMASILAGAAGGAHMATPRSVIDVAKGAKSGKLGGIGQVISETVEGVTAPQQAVETPMTFADIARSLKTDLETVDLYDQKQSAAALSKLNSLKAMATDEDMEELNNIKLDFAAKISKKLEGIKTPTGEIDTTVFGSDPAAFLEEFSYADEGRRTEVINALSSDSKYAKLGKALAEIDATGDTKAKEILDGIAAVQNQIVKGQFATSKNVHRSMIDNYKLASSTNEDEARIGLDKMQEFGTSQLEKKAKLESGLSESLARMDTAVKRLAASKGVSPTGAIKALADLEQLTIADKNGKTVRKGYAEEVMALTGTNDISAAKEVYKNSIKPLLDQQVPTQKVQYTLDVLAQTAKDGVFEIDFKNTLAAYAENNKVEILKPSAAKRLINSIDTEIQALDSLVIMANKNREARSKAAATLSEIMGKVGIKPADLGEEQAALPNEPGKVEKAKVEQLVKEEAKLDEAIVEKAKQTGRVQEDGTVDAATREDLKEKLEEDRKAAPRKPIVEINKASTNEQPSTTPTKSTKATTEDAIAGANVQLDSMKDVKKKVKDAIDSKATYREIYDMVIKANINDEDKKKLLAHVETRMGKAKIASDTKINSNVMTTEELENVKVKVDRKIALFTKLIAESREIYVTNRSKLGKLYKEINGYQRLKQAYYKEIKKLSEKTFAAGEELKELEKELASKKAKLKAHKNADLKTVDGESQDSFVKRQAANKKMLEKIAKDIADLETKIAAAKDAIKARTSRIEELKGIVTGIKEGVEAKKREAKSMAKDEVDKLLEKSKKVKALTSSYSNTISIVHGLRKGLKSQDTKEKGVKGKDEQHDLFAGTKKVGTLKIAELFKPSYGSKLSGSLKDASDAVQKYAKGMAEIITRYIPVRGKTDGKLESILMREDMSRALLFDSPTEKGKDWTVNENVAAAIGIAATQELENVMVQLTERDDEIVAKYYGVDPNEVEGDSLEKLKALGIPVKYLTESIGKSVRELLGLKLLFDENTTEEDKLEKVARIEVALGMHGLVALEKKGIVTLKVTDSATVGKLMGKEDAKEGYTMTSVVVNTEKLGSEDEKVSSLVKELDVVDRSAYHRWEPLTKAELDRMIVNIRRNPFTKAPDELVEAVKEYSGYTWHVKLNPSIMAMMKQGAEKVKKLEGYVSQEEMNEMIYEVKESAKGKNLAISREVDTMFEVLNELTGENPRDNAIWFDWFIAKSFRTMLDSRGFQPQSKKLHRSLVYTDEMQSEIDTENDNEMNLLKIGVAQAMGYDIDKHAPEASIALGEKLLSLDVDMLEDKIFTTNKDLEYLEVGNVKLKRPVLTHVLDGVATIREYQNAQAEGSGTFTTQLAIEVDGITDGALLKMVQLGQGKLVKTRGSGISNEEYLAKAGFLTDDEVEMGQVRDKSNKANYKPDSYITLQETVKEEDIINALTNDTPSELKELVKEKEDATALAEKLVKVLGGFTRDMAKYAHMPFWYAAGKKKIKAEIAEVLLKDLATQFMKAKAAEETDTEVAKLAKMLGVDKVTVNQWKNIPMTQIMVTVGDKEISVRQLLKATTEATYGAAMWNALEAEFGDIIKLNDSINEAIKTMFAIWKSAYDARIKALGDKVTRDDKVKILNDLLELFPTVKTVVSTGVGDSLALFKTAVVSREEEFTKYGAIKAHVKGNENRDAYTSGEVILDYIAAVAAGSVLPIHAEDSANVIQAVKNALHMWDAALLGLKQAIPTTKKFNKTVFENSIKWSMLEEIRVSLTRVLGSAEGKVYMDNLVDTVSDESIDAEKRIEAFNTLTAIENSLQELDAAIEGNKEFKQDLVTNIKSVQHIQFIKAAEYKPDNTRDLEEEAKKARKEELAIIKDVIESLPVAFKKDKKAIADLLERCE